LFKHNNYREKNLVLSRKQLPLNLATMFIFSYHSGFTKLAKGSAIYTSRGTGTSGPPIRFLTTPEITIIDVVKK
jgi:hypothetical protein